MKYIFVILLAGLLFDLCGCSPEPNNSISGINGVEYEADPEPEFQIIAKYKISELGRVIEFKTTGGTTCVAHRNSLKSAAISCDWVRRQ